MSTNNFDLTSKFSEFLDVHQLLKILNFYETQEIYGKQDILNARLELLSKTNMVGFAIEVRKNAGLEVTAELEARAQPILDSFNELKSKHAFLGIFDQERRDELLKIGENWNLAYLTQHHKIDKEDVNAIYRLAKWFFEVGQYEESSLLLKHFRALNTDPAKEMSALWGKLCADIVSAKWAEAAKDLSLLKEAIENTPQPASASLSVLGAITGNVTPIKQLQQRCWYIHWALFVHFPRPGGMQQLLEQFLGSDRYLNAIQSAIPWVFRYLVVASIVTKTKQKELIRVLDQETYTDPLIAFFKALYGKYNFDEAEQHLALCGPVLRNDYFVNGEKEVKQLTDEFTQAGKFAICEAFCAIHSTIDISMMAKKLGMNNEEAECWIVNFIRSAKLEAKIDTANNLVRVQPRIPSVYQQSLEKTKILMLRTGIPNQVDQKTQAK